MALSTRSESPLSDVPDIPASPPERARRKKVAKKKVEVAAEVQAEDVEVVEERPRGRRKRKAAVHPVVEDKNELTAEDEVSVGEEKPKKRRKKSVAAPKAAEDGAEGEANATPRKRRTRKTPEEERVFDMPPIENILSTTFKGFCFTPTLPRFSLTDSAVRPPRLCMPQHHPPQVRPSRLLLTHLPPLHPRRSRSRSSAQSSPPERARPPHARPVEHEARDPIHADEQRDVPVCEPSGARLQSGICG